MFEMVLCILVGSLMKFLRHAGDLPFSPLSYKSVLNTDATKLCAFVLGIGLIKPSFALGSGGMI